MEVVGVEGVSFSPHLLISVADDARDDSKDIRSVFVQIIPDLDFGFAADGAEVDAGVIDGDMIGISDARLCDCIGGNVVVVPTKSE